jgi:hypothetical protein
MQPESNKPNQPKKALTKNWKTQAQRTADSVKKLKKGIDLLTPFVQAYPGETIHRTEIPYRVYAMMQGVQCRSRNPKHLLHFITTAFFETAFKYDMGKQIVLAEAWKKLMQTVGRADTGLVRQWNNEESRDNFFWQIAGHAESYPHPCRHKPISIVRVTSGPRKGKLVPCYELKGKYVPLPNGGQAFFRAFCAWAITGMKNRSSITRSPTCPCRGRARRSRIRSNCFSGSRRRKRWTLWKNVGRKSAFQVRLTHFC